MPSPIFWKTKIIAVKKETTVGTDAVPAAANAVLLKDVQFQPMEGESVSRNVERAFMGAQEPIETAFRAVLTGTFELVGAGSLGVAPGWSVLMRMMGVAETITATTKVEYTPISTSMEAGSVYFFVGPTRYVMLGSRATGELSLTAQGIPQVRVTITGLFTLPTDQTALTGVDLSNFIEPQAANKTNTPTFTIGGTAFVMRNYTLNFGCDVQARMLVGRESIDIVDKQESLKVTVEAVPMATYNPYTQAQTPKPRIPIVLLHGTAAGRRVQIDIPTAVQGRPSGIDNQQGVVEWPLDFTPLPTTAGNDQWKITLT